MESYEFFARCASGFEALLADELKKMGIKRIRPLKGGVAFFSDIGKAYRTCLWSRVSSRVLLVLARVPAGDADALYEGIRGIDWMEHVRPDATISVYAHGVNEELRNTQFTAMKAKDALCDRLRAVYGVRPDVKPVRPDVTVDVGIRNQKATVSIDLAGEPLHRRGYRAEGVQTAAPLKESLAAALVLESGWEELSRTGAPFVDPLCGSGTLAIEAAMVAADRAPGLSRDYWGFTGWVGHDADLWSGLIDEADERFAVGLPAMAPVFAADVDASAVEIAEANAKRAGFSGSMRFSVADIADLGDFLGDLIGDEGKPGLVVTNPPYGERLGSKESIARLYKSMSLGFGSLADGWRIAIITSDDSVDIDLGMVPIAKKPFYNGRIETELRNFMIDRSSQVFLEVPIPPSGEMRRIQVLEANSDQFAARFRKVAKERKKWAARQGVSCYRIYDADLPDYSVAIDIYRESSFGLQSHSADNSETRIHRTGGSGHQDRRKGGFEHQNQKKSDSGHQRSFLVVTEYKAPKTVDGERARRRFKDVLTLAAALEGIPPTQVFAKERRREKGGGQYREAGTDALVIPVQENGFNFEVDLGSYLDTGLFLDHRLTRGMIGGMAQGKRFLNLFAYTGTATVYAADGGALETTTVDLSNTYLAWAQRNMALNGFSDQRHRYIKADVLEWIGREAEAGYRYGLIFVDPPTFSNSKAMGKNTWSVERDHVGLLVRTARLLDHGGAIIFSCNLRSFNPDIGGLDRGGLKIADITPKTIPEDFRRNPKIHHCYRVTKA